MFVCFGAKIEGWFEGVVVVPKLKLNGLGFEACGWPAAEAPNITSQETEFGCRGEGEGHARPSTNEDNGQSSWLIVTAAW